MPSFATLRTEYDELWRTMVIHADKTESVSRIARRLIGLKSRYQAVARRTGVPWVVIAALHERESNADFDSYLGNGDPLRSPTRHVPSGRGPFASWEGGAIDALHHDGLDRARPWTPARACYEIERFNGFGYRLHHAQVKSPYLWSFSNHYAHGKYVADGRFDSAAVDAQCGAMPIVKCIMELDASAGFPATRKPAVAATTAAAAGAAAALAQHSLTAALALALAAELAIAGMYLWRKFHP